MNLDDFKPGDLVEVARLSAVGPRALCGCSPVVCVGQQGIIVEMFDADFRVLCGSECHLAWEANLRPDEVTLVTRLGWEEADSRVKAIYRNNRP